MKVCILAAGKGTRMNAFGGKLHKGLLPLGNLAIISQIMAQFPRSATFVVALGHLADQVRDYIAIAHPEHIVQFVSVDNFDGPGAGPGYSLWCCRQNLAEPFYITACDTLVTTAPPPLNENFIGVQSVDDPKLWCTVDAANDGTVRKLYFKTMEGTHLGFIGFAGIYDHDAFWDGLGAKIGGEGEYQVNDGLAALVPSGLRATEMGWIDTGVEENYKVALRKFPKNYSFEGKTTDVTYRIDDRVIKFFPNDGAARSRYSRGLANSAFAKVIDSVGSFFSYRFADGVMLSSVLRADTCLASLRWLDETFWRASPCDPHQFEEVCRRFYGEKTLDRLDDYLRRFEPEGETSPMVINGLVCRTVRQSLMDLPYEFWSGGLPSTFHGDLHADNVVVAEDGGLVLIDWRQDFAGLRDVGDRYYDFAKFYHTLDLSVETMDSGRYWIKLGSDGIDIGHEDTPTQAEAREAFWTFVEANSYDYHRVKILNAIIFINMAPLYSKSMARYLYHLGRFRLAQALAVPETPQQ
ncbi:NTP transferase domain-containing protein [Methylocapsa polymorpha]|uniref:NTP transferase domain-containing protein n=1 Tax=Methylocapsa polymorpha TaxID=3080828 RepID=A0ABZ0HSZ0_9HYPH|nr:NTP transferase domain-containing protein [Methylocapsa sp. RX1]